MARPPLAVLASGASGLSASLPQDKGHGNLSNLVKAIVTDSVNESTESGRIFSSAATSNVAPAILSTIKSANKNVSHDKKDKIKVLKIRRDIAQAK